MRATAAEAPALHVQEISDTIEAMAMGGCPSNVTDQAWFVLLKDLRTFTAEWLSVALDCGWSMADLYGTAPAGRRSGLSGVAVLLHGRKVAVIERNYITIADQAGRTSTFYRHAPGCSDPFDRSCAVMIWDRVAVQADEALA